MVMLLMEVFLSAAEMTTMLVLIVFTLRHYIMDFRRARPK